MSFEIWTSEKKLKESDLVFTKALKINAQQDLFLKISHLVAALNPIFSEGLQIFETLTDLILMGHDEVLFLKTDNLIHYKNHLKLLRYPNTVGFDQDLETKFKKYPWPFGSKIKFERRGDRAGVEVKFFVSSPTDLTKLIASLERVQLEMTKPS
jgi:hypothetical protein